MAAMPSNPSVMFEQAADRLREAQLSAGLDEADCLVKELDDIRFKAEKGPGDLIDNLRDALKAFMDSIDQAVWNPATVMGDGAILSACAPYYGSVVLARLKNLKAEAETLFTKIAYLATTVAKPFGELGKGLGEVMGAIVTQMRGLRMLPQLIKGLALKVQCPRDLTKMDIGDLKQILDVSSLAVAFDKLRHVRSDFGPLMQMVSEALQALAAFVEEGPGKVRYAFDVPLLGGCIAGGSAAMQDILQQLELLRRLSGQPLLETCAKARQAVSDMDVELMREPIEAFSKLAQEELNNLDGAIKGAKAAHEAARAAAATILGGAPCAAENGVAKQKSWCKFWGR